MNPSKINLSFIFNKFQTQQIKKEPPIKEVSTRKSPAEVPSKQPPPPQSSVTQTTPDPESNKKPPTITKTEAKTKHEKPKTNLPAVEENDTVHGVKATISEHIYDKDPKSELSECERIKLFGINK